MTRSICKLSSTLLVLIAFLGCSSIHIQTGSESPESATENAEIRGSSLKSQFADRLRNAIPLMQMDIVWHLVDSTTAMYLRYGDRISVEWVNGNDGRGESVLASEMRELIFNSTRDNQPIFDAYDEMIDYGFEQIELTRFFDSRIIGMLEDCRSTYDAIVNAVLYPNRDLEDYRESLFNSRMEAEKTSHLLSLELEQFR